MRHVARKRFGQHFLTDPAIIGAIVDRTGSYTPAWWTMAGSAAVALVLLLFVREGRTLS